MSLSTELARILPPIPHPYMPRFKCALEVEADRIADAFGGVPHDPKPPEDRLAKVERRLEADDGLRRLGRGELKLVPYLIWGANPCWRDDRAFIRAFLSAVDAKWPTGGLRRLWRHYMLNLDPDSPATLEMAGWLHGHQHRLPEPLQLFSTTYNLFDPNTAADALGSRALPENGLAADLSAIGLPPALFRTSALCVATLEAVGLHLPTAPGTAQVINRLRALLDDQPENAIAEAVCTDGARAKALRALVDGLVEWHEGVGAAGEQLDSIMQFLLELNGDPRFLPDRWDGRVSARSKAAMER